jgi:multiple sugar transport system substrate-binding protein
MTHQENYIEWVIGPGAGFPTLQTALDAPEMQAPFYLAAAEALEGAVCTAHVGSLERIPEADELIANVIYNLIKGNPTLDIATELQAAQDQYNAGN